MTKEVKDRIAIGLIALAMLACCVALSHGQTWEIPPIVELSDNESTPERIVLGMMLFYETGLSPDRSVSCAKCHRPERAFTDGLATSIGFRGAVGRRNAPAIINPGITRLFMRDGRILQLEGQPQAPLLSAGEHGMTEAGIVAFLNSSADYKRRFAECYGEVPSLIGVSKALACFMRELISWNAPMDRYLRGETWALDRNQKLGLAVFLNCSHAAGWTDEAKIECVSSGKAIGLFHKPSNGSCAVCHNGPNYDWDWDQVHRFHNCGVGVLDLDLGRQIITDRREDIDAYKTASLRELRLTAPYFHRGSAATVEEVIAIKERGGEAFDPLLDPAVRSYKWTAAEREQLRVFLLTAFEGDYRERVAKLGIKADGY